MKRGLLLPVMFVSGIVAGILGVATAGSPADKPTGDVVVINQGRWHRFEFAAHERGEDPSGNGFLAHQRLNAGGT